MKYEQELGVALATVRQAAKACRSVQQGITREVLDKKDKSPVTVADFASQAIVCHALSQAFPNDRVIAEEDSAALKTDENAAFLGRIVDEVHQTGLEGTVDDLCRWIDHGRQSGNASRFWTLDPIDGTKGFVRGEQYAISLALIVDGQIEVAVLGCPNLPAADAWDRNVGALFSAVRGEGAYVRPLDDDGSFIQPVRVSSTRDTTQARLCESVESGHSAHGASAQIAEKLGIVNEPVRLDSQAKYAIVARGEADIYLRLPTRADYQEKIWDHAGGVLVVEEAGGRVTDIIGRPLEFTHGSTLAVNKGVVVTNGNLHDAVIEAVAAVLS